jgi:hypothetical protein
MALTTTKPKPTAETAPTLAALTEAYAAAGRDLGRLRAVAEQGTSALDRLQARRALPEAEARLEEAELALERAKHAGVEIERQRVAQAMAEVDPEIRARLKALMPVLEAAEVAMAEFRMFALAADARLGRAYYAAALVWPALVSEPGGESLFRFWMRHLREGGWSL